MHQDDTQPVEYRRRESDALLLHIQELQKNVKTLDEKMTYHHGIFRSAVEESVELVYVSAFPDGDPLGHRRHHELVIKKEEERAAFWTKMKEEIFKWGLIGFLGWAVFYLWQAFLKGPTK